MNTNRPVRPRRALLFMPGDDRHKIEKGAGLGVDALIMDLEDGVALSRKDAARESVVAALREVDFGRAERLVRVNAVGGPWWADDLAAVLPAGPDGIVVPKVESAAHARAVAERLGEDRCPMLVFIETALGVVNLREIAAALDEGDALVFGGEDLAGDLGATRTPEGHEIAYARSAVVIHARAARVQAIDTIYAGLADVEGLAREARFARSLGYTGKLAIHPRQVDPIQRAFTPGEAEVDHARRLAAEFRRQQAAGMGAFEFEGNMIDMPMLRAAEAVLARARAAGILRDE